MSMDLFVARTMITKASLIFRGPIEITESQVVVCLPYQVVLVSTFTFFFFFPHFSSELPH